MWYYISVTNTGTKYNTMLVTIPNVILCSGTAPNVILSLRPAPNVTLWLCKVLNGTLCLSTVLNWTISWYGTTVTMSWSRLPMPLPTPNVISLCTTFLVRNVIIIIGLILVTALNAFPGTLFINLVYAHVVFERSTSFNGRGASLEQSCLGVGNSKTKRILRQQLTIIYWDVLV